MPYAYLMTKRKFDQETKRAMGSGLASDERCTYREERMREHNGSGSHIETRKDNYISRRAARMRELRRHRSLLDFDGELLATLGRGSPFRAPQAYRARIGDALLNGRFG